MEHDRGEAMRYRLRVALSMVEMRARPRVSLSLSLFSLSSRYFFVLFLRLFFSLFLSLSLRLLLHLIIRRSLAKTWKNEKCGKRDWFLGRDDGGSYNSWKTSSIEERERERETGRGFRRIVSSLLIQTGFIFGLDDSSLADTRAETRKSVLSRILVGYRVVWRV